MLQFVPDDDDDDDDDASLASLDGDSDWPCEDPLTLPAVEREEWEEEEEKEAEGKASIPALVWNRDSWFTTRLEVCVRTVMSPP